MNMRLNWHKTANESTSKLNLLNMRQSVLAALYKVKYQWIEQNNNIPVNPAS